MNNSVIGAIWCRLGRALKKHIKRDPLWWHVATWRGALLEEFQRRADLNRSIRKKAKEVFGLNVNWMREPQETWLAPGTIWWIRATARQMRPRRALANFRP